MNIVKILETIGARKGQNVSAIWKRDLKTRAGVLDTVQKVTAATVRTGIDFANTKNQHGKKTGVLPWGQWLAFPWHIGHNGKDYLRLYPASGNALPSVSYLLNGKPATREDVEPICLASEFKTSATPPECFTIKAESIVSIG